MCPLARANPIKPFLYCRYRTDKGGHAWIAMESWQFFGLDLFEFAFKLQYFCWLPVGKMIGGCLPAWYTKRVCRLCERVHAREISAHRETNVFQFWARCHFFPQPAIYSSPPSRRFVLSRICGKINDIRVQAVQEPYIFALPSVHKLIPKPKMLYRLAIFEAILFNTTIEFSHTSGNLNHKSHTAHVSFAGVKIFHTNVELTMSETPNEANGL